ncbi:MAG: hypothetical protein AABX83_00035 [Nanoarchaeota archaeon]
MQEIKIKDQVSEEVKIEKESWIKTKPEQLDKIIKELAEQGNSPAKIGLILRDKHGIPKVKLLGRKVEKILKNTNTKYITEKEDIEKKIDILKKHIEKNKHDKGANRSLTKKLWRSYAINKKENLQ